MPRSPLVVVTSVVGTVLAAVRLCLSTGTPGHYPRWSGPPLEARCPLGFSCICSALGNSGSFSGYLKNRIFYLFKYLTLLWLM